MGTHPPYTDRDLNILLSHFDPDKLVMDPDDARSILILGDDSPVEGQILCSDESEAIALVDILIALPHLVEEIRELRTRNDRPSG